MRQACTPTHARPQPALHPALHIHTPLPYTHTLQRTSPSFWTMLWRPSAALATWQSTGPPSTSPVGGWRLRRAGEGGWLGEANRACSERRGVFMHMPSLPPPMPPCSLAPPPPPPGVTSFAGHIYGSFPPGRFGSVAGCARQMLHMLRAHSRAYDLIKALPGAWWGGLGVRGGQDGAPAAASWGCGGGEAGRDGAPAKPQLSPCKLGWARWAARPLGVKPRSDRPHAAPPAPTPTPVRCRRRRRPGGHRVELLLVRAQALSLDAALPAVDQARACSCPTACTGGR